MLCQHECQVWELFQQLAPPYWHRGGVSWWMYCNTTFVRMSCLSHRGYRSRWKCAPKRKCRICWEFARRWLALSGHFVVKLSSPKICFPTLCGAYHICMMESCVKSTSTVCLMGRGGCRPLGVTNRIFQWCETYAWMNWQFSSHTCLALQLAVNFFLFWQFVCIFKSVYLVYLFHNSEVSFFAFFFCHCGFPFLRSMSLILLAMLVLQRLPKLSSTCG